MSSKMFDMCLLLTLLSISSVFCDFQFYWDVTFLNGYPCSHFDYYYCPWACYIDDCYQPTYLNCDDFPSSRLPSVCRCSSHDQYDCPPGCHPRDCRGHFAWYWYLVIAGVIVGIIALIIIIVCIKMSMSARSPGVNQPQVVASQPNVVATVNV